MSQLALFDALPAGPMPDGASDEWYTPAWLAAWLPPVGFDPCRAAGSAVQAATWLDIREGQDGLTVAWPIGPELDGSRIAFVNPPYSDCASWVTKCRQEHDRTGATIVALVPCYAGDKYWHRNVWGVAGREGDLILWGRGREVTGLSVRSETNGIPDLSDAATRGAILELVREAWGDPYTHCQFGIAESNQPDCWMAIVDFGIGRREFVGRTEIESLLVALEAAP